MMRVAIIGSGVIGSVVAAYLPETGLDITLYERKGPRAEQLATNGVRVFGLHGDRTRRLPVRTDASSESPFDVVIVCVKSYQTAEAARQHSALISRDTAAISLQNGIGNVEALKDVWPHASVFAASITLGAYLDQDGIVRHVGAGETRLGAFDAAQADRAIELAKALSSVPLPIFHEADMTHLLYAKLAVNCVINPLTALLDTRNGVVAETPGLCELAAGIVNELVAVAAAQGIVLSADELLERALQVSRLTSRNLSSMLTDIRRGSPTEIEAINGAVARLGEQLGVPAPINRSLTQLVLARQNLGPIPNYSA
jgi:2-dehydropantoate 2-reductase